MKTAFPSLMTLLESSIFTFQHIKYLAISKRMLFIYTILHVNMKTAMTTTTKNSIVTPALFGGRTEWVCFGCQIFIIRKVKPSSNGTGSPASETCSAQRQLSCQDHVLLLQRTRAWLPTQRSVGSHAYNSNKSDPILAS